MQSGKKVKHSKKEHPESFVSPETEQHVAVPVDENHAELVESPAPNQEDHDVAEEQFTRKHETGVFEGKGEAPKREVKTNSKATLGRHVTSDPGVAAKDRHAHVQSVRKAREAENWSK